MTPMVFPPLSVSFWTSGLFHCSEHRQAAHSEPHIIAAEESFAIGWTLTCSISPCRATDAFSRVIMTSAEEHRQGWTTWKTLNLSSCARSFGKDTIRKNLKSSIVSQVCGDIELGSTTTKSSGDRFGPNSTSLHQTPCSGHHKVFSIFYPLIYLQHLWVPLHFYKLDFDYYF